MNKYIIVKNDENSDISKKVFKVIKNTTMISLGGAFAAKKIVDDINAKEITISQANDFINGSNSDWKLGAIYIEHPRKNKVLIPIKEYKDFILREMVADIANYIQDNIKVSRLTIGIVSSFNSGLGSTIPVNNLNVDAKINCKIAKDYVVNYVGSSKTKIRSNYIWIDKFPDVKVAVSHDVAEFEVIKETSIELNVGANLSDTIKGSISSENKMKFYISYAR